MKKTKEEKGNALADALNGIASMPAPKSRLPEPVKFEGPQSILFVYEMMPEEVDLYFFSTPETLPKTLMGALVVMENITVGCSDLSNRQSKAFDYINAAMCAKADHLDDANPNDCNRFAHLFVPYKIERSATAAPCFPILGGRALRIIRSGHVM